MCSIYEGQWRNHSLTIKFTSNTSTNWTWKNCNFRFKRFYVFFLCQFLIPDFWITFLHGHVWNKQSLNSRIFSVVSTYKIRIFSVYIWHSLYALCCSELARPGPTKWSGPARPGPARPDIKCPGTHP